MRKTVNFPPVLDELSPIGQKWRAVGNRSLESGTPAIRLILVEIIFPLRFIGCFGLFKFFVSVKAKKLGY